MSTRAGWTLVCPECYSKPGSYYGVLKLRSERIFITGGQPTIRPTCPNCGTRLVDVDRMKDQATRDQL